MAAKFNLSQHSVPHSPSSPQTLASAISSPAAKRALVCRNVYKLDRSSLFGPALTNLYRSRSSPVLHKSKSRSIKRACSASLNAFSDEEFSEQMQELALKFQSPFDEDADNSIHAFVEYPSESENTARSSCSNFLENQTDFISSKTEPVEPTDWNEIIPGSIERKANSVELPFSLRIIKRKKQWHEGIKGAGESTYSSVKKAFSSMVFIIQELQSYTLQMRQILFYEDLQGILARVQQDMNASFVWLFQQVFSQTPTLMVYVMILLANYSVYSISSDAAIASNLQPPTQIMESVSFTDNHNFDTSAIKTFSVSSGKSKTKTTSIGGINGGGGKSPVISSGTDGDGRFDGSVSFEYHETPAQARTGEEESVSGQSDGVDELRRWNEIVDEAKEMDAAIRDESLDHETMLRFVSPVNTKIEEDDYTDNLRTELLYQTSLAQDPTNSLLLTNYAQFLFLIAHDYDRAEIYFKRAVKVEPRDAEALNKYARFLWQARNDLWAAEETYLEAISVEPTNSHYSANYASFLWETGAEDTCYPLDNDVDV